MVCGSAFYTYQSYLQDNHFKPSDYIVQLEGENKLGVYCIALDKP